jgi:tetratricopeptide (TPR) repeat protein
MILHRILGPVMIACLLSAGCATSKSSDAAGGARDTAVEENAGKPKSKSQSTEKPSVTAIAKSPAYQASPATFITTTLANEDTFSGQIPQPKLEDVLRELERVVVEHNDDGGALISYLVFRRLAGTSRDFQTVLEKRGSTASAKDPWILIECSYTALLRKDYGMVQYLLDSAEAVGKGKENVAAAVLHARGLLFYNEKKTVLAMAAFREAAKQNYEPSILTLTFFALRTGDHEGALAQLSRLKDSATGNLNVKAALGVAHRQAGKAQEAVEYLRSVHRARPADKRLMWNLALAMSAIPGKRKDAIMLLEKYNEAPGSIFDVDTRARTLLSKLQSLEEAARVESAKGSSGSPGQKAESSSSPASGQ